MNGKGTSTGKWGGKQVRGATGLAKLCTTVGLILLNSTANYSST